MPAFTIITVCLNIASTIRRTCESIVNQTFQDFQWIVVDGASTDGTLDILKEYSNRIDILISEPDKGIYNAMNKGIRLVNGEYINFMNGGDEFYDNNVLKNVYESNNNKDVIYGGINIIDNSENGNVIVNIPTTIPDKRKFYQWSIHHQSTFIKTNVQKKYPFNEQYKICADYDFFVKILFKGYTFAIIPTIIAKFYSGGYGCINHEKALQENEVIRKKYYRIFDKLKYDNNCIEKINFIKMVITHPRYIAGWLKKKIKNIFN